METDFCAIGSDSHSVTFHTAAPSPHA